MNDFSSLDLPKNMTMPKANIEHDCLYCPRLIAKGEKHLSVRKVGDMHRICIPPDNRIAVLLKDHDWDYLAEGLKLNRRWGSRKR